MLVKTGRTKPEVACRPPRCRPGKKTIGASSPQNHGTNHPSRAFAVAHADGSCGGRTLCIGHEQAV